ncbi:MAG: cupin domain-containing protein, partial [Anaerolineales bacterium]|nr:cupin domain-containing protein [Anaerolineales bacterium]
MSEKKVLDNIMNREGGIPRALNVGIEGRVYHGDHSTAMVAYFEPNAGGKLHQHPQEQWGFVIEGSGWRVHEDHEIPCQKGDFWVTPGGILHTVRAGAEGLVLLDIFAPAREDYRQSGAGWGDA